MYQLVQFSAALPWVSCSYKPFIFVHSFLFSLCCAPFRLWLELLLVVESLRGLHAVRVGLHAGGSLRHLPPAGLCIVRGDPGLPGCLHWSNAGHTATLLQLSEQIHRGHEVRIQYWTSHHIYKCRHFCSVFDISLLLSGSQERQTEEVFMNGKEAKLILQLNSTEPVMYWFLLTILINVESST